MHASFWISTCERPIRQTRSFEGSIPPSSACKDNARHEVKRWSTPPKKISRNLLMWLLQKHSGDILEKNLFILRPLQFMTNFAFRTLVSEKENASHLTVTARSWLWELTKSNEASWVLFYQLNHFLVYRLFLLQRGTQDTFHQLNFLSDKV